MMFYLITSYMESFAPTLPESFQDIDDHTSPHFSFSLAYVDRHSCLRKFWSVSRCLFFGFVIQNSLSLKLVADNIRKPSLCFLSCIIIKSVFKTWE